MRGRRGDIWVFHRGALGDGVLLWPMLRALVKRGHAVSLASDVSKAGLAERELGVRAVNIEQKRFNDLWVTGAAAEAGRIVAVPRVERVVCLLHVQGREQTWAANAGAMFPGAELERHEELLDRRLAIRLMEEAGGSVRDVKVRVRGAHSPVVLHVGAGSAGKRWPMGLWEELARRLRERGVSVLALAGEVEAEQFGGAELEALGRMEVKHPKDLGALVEVLRHGRAMIAADCGPGHLAAQLGVPTLSLFGPTLPERWSPIGPAVRVIAPGTPSAMDWLRVDRVLDETLDLLEGLEEKAERKRH